MSEDERRTAAVYKFYDLCSQLKRYDSIRLHTHTELGGETLIEIDRYYGDRKGERILRVTQEDEVAAYEQAADQLKQILEQREKDRKAGQRGA